jgi:glycosyltransferase involved in cell wall biosynthesis
VILFIIINFSLIGLVVYLTQLQTAVCEIQQLTPPQEIIAGDVSNVEFPSISVIVPAYNEADNIQACITSILNSSKLTAPQLEVWVVDDGSTDETLTIIQTLRQHLSDSRLKIITGLPRPDKQVWKGKNWACVQAAERAEGEFFLFIDADVRLQPGAIEAAVQIAASEHIDLLNCIPSVVCGSLSEWLVQPLIFINLLISLNSTAVKNPKTATAFAAGPLMLFRRSAYEQVGGHRGVADQVAEDVALARRIKQQGLNLKYFLGANIASLRMYRCWVTLWEGWTKVLYVGAQRNPLIMLLLATLMVSLYAVPWLELIILLLKYPFTGWVLLDFVVITIALVAIWLQYRVRSLLLKALQCPTKYWWLNGLGGILVAIIAIASVIKTETGWGWTWRGRSLK